MGVTLKDIAQKAGVSISTVSRVINDDQESPVSEDTRALVWRLVKEMGYVKNGRDRSIKRNTKKIGYIFNETPNIYNHPYFSVILEAIEAEIKARGYTVGFSFCETDIKNQAIRHQMLSERAAGIIVVSDFIEEELLNELKENFPNIVFIDTIREKLISDLIYVDREKAGYEITNYLIKLGHKVIGFIGGSYVEKGAPTFYQEKRFLGFKRAMEEANLIIDKSLIRDGRWLMEDGYNMMQDIIKKGKIPTAIFSASDLMAIGAMRAIHEAGLNIPDDISVISYDGVEMAKFTNPPLTTVHVPKKGIGKLAVKMLLEQINNDWDIPFPSKVIVPTELIVRQSVGKPRKKL